MYSVAQNSILNCGTLPRATRAELYWASGRMAARPNAELSNIMPWAGTSRGPQAFLDNPGSELFQV